MVAVASEVVLIYEEIVIPVQLPEFTVNNVEMLVAEVLRDLVDVFFFF